MDRDRRVIWTHSFAPEVESSGVFMHVSVEPLRQRGWDVRLLQMSELGNPARLLSCRRRLGREVGPNPLLHAQFGSGCGWCSAAYPGRKIITIRGYDWYGWREPGLSSRVRGYVAHRFTRASLNRFDLVLVVSNRLAAELQESGCQKPIRVLPDPIDLERFRPMEREHARAALGFSDDRRPWVGFLTVDVNRPVKRVSLARAAVASMRQFEPEAQLMCISGAHHDQMPLWMNAIDVLLMTSAYEGWPNVVKEALACNVPFVSTDVSDLSGVAKVLRGCYVCDDVPGELGGALVGALAAGRPAGLRKFARRFSLRAHTEELAQVYEKIQ